MSLLACKISKFAFGLGTLLITISLLTVPAAASDLRERLVHLNARLLAAGLSGCHGARFVTTSPGSGENFAVHPPSNHQLPFEGVVTGGQAVGWGSLLEVGPLGTKIMIDKLHFGMDLQIKTRDEFRSVPPRPIKHVALAKDLAGLVPDPEAQIRVTLHFEFEFDRAAYGADKLTLVSTRRTEGQLRSLLGVDRALQKLRRALNDDRVEVRSSLLVSNSGSISSDPTARMNLGNNLFLNLKLPQGVSPLDAYLQFYGFLFEAVTDDRPAKIEAPPHLSFADRISKILDRTSPRCSTALTVGSRVSYVRGSTLTLRTPLGNLDVRMIKP